MITTLFHRQIDTPDGLIEVVRAEGAAHVSVYTGPFVWQIETVDLGAVLRLLAHVRALPSEMYPTLALAQGAALHVGFGAEQTHVWISACNAHLRLPRDAAHLLVAALSEARAHITRAVEAHAAEVAAVTGARA